MSQQFTKDILKFFFYAFLDEELALKTALSAQGEFTRKIESQVDPRHLVIQITDKLSKKFRPHGLFQPRLTFQNGWESSETIDISVWMAFCNHSAPDEYHSIIWIYFLGYSIFDVAAALSVPVGTIKFRLSQNLRELGALV